MYMRLGFYLDGWADLIDDMGGLTDEVRQALMKDLERRKMPSIKYKDGLVSFDLMKTEKRRYALLKTDPGVTTTMDIGEHGTDLYVSWRTYIKPTINVLTIVVLIVFGIIIGGLGEHFVFFLLGFVGGAVLLWMAGAGIFRDPYKFFLDDVTVFDAEDITALSLSAHHALLSALDQTGIDTSKLRIKEKFSGGRKGEDI